MDLSMILTQKEMTPYQCSKRSGIPYTTLLELIRGKSSIEKCSGETIYKLAAALDMTMDELYIQLRPSESRASFETFKSNVCHEVKLKGDLKFIIDVLEENEIQKYWDRKWYPEAYYMLAMLDYLSRENSLPVCHNYDSIRASKLTEVIYPRDIELAARLDSSLDIKSQAIEESIPEFIRFNIVEKEIRNVC